jgi:prolyl-tRNA synthetase
LSFRFLNEKNEHHHAYMTCYGVSTRLLATTLATHGDDKGLVLPSQIAKIQVVIVPIITKKVSEPVYEAAREYVKNLEAAGVSVYNDDSNKSGPEKFNIWETKGVPVRLEVGPRDVENKTVMLVRRDTGAKESVPAEKAIERVQELLKEIDANLRARALAFHNDHITTCTTIEEAAAALQTKGGFARVPFYTRGAEGVDGDKIIHAKTGGEVRGFVHDEKFEGEYTCVATGKPATTWAYVARSY